MQAKHVRSLDSGHIEFESELGSISRLYADTMPILRRLSIKRLILAAGAVREPHWHANATELSYCVSGQSLVSVLDNGSVFSSFTVSAGQMFHIPSGAVHHIENLGADRAEFIVAFRHERPEDFSMHAAFGAMTDAVLGNTYDLPGASFAPIARSTRSAFIVGRQGPAAVPAVAAFNNPHKFDVEAQHPLLASQAGSARFARDQFWPALKDISMYSLRITHQGMREPHWHPETAEMGYVHRGRARMTVLDPDGTTDTYDLKAGDVYFIPRAYPHHIEQLGDEEIHFLIFFDQPTPGDIGYRATASAFSRGVLAATLGTTEEVLPTLPFTPADPLVVTRINARDP
ncbi:cupin domain-containing protein [Methylobacterium goesingense]|nr:MULTISPECIES: cupin domain-containing protein [Methylobacterium]MCI9881774.1 cupin domain-containing protein [Methylobacterium goesingense]